MCEKGSEEGLPGRRPNRRRHARARTPSRDPPKDPINAVEINDYDEFTTLQQELYDYETASEFDYVKDSKD